MAGVISRYTLKCTAAVSAAALLAALVAPAQANGRNKAIGIGVGVGVGLLMLNELAKAAEKEKRQAPRERTVAPRKQPSDDSSDEPRKSRAFKANPDAPKIDKADANPGKNNKFQALPDKPEATEPPKLVDAPLDAPKVTPRRDLPTLPERPRDYVYALPDKPVPSRAQSLAGGQVLTPGGSMVARDLGLAQRTAAFSAGPASAATMFMALATENPGVAGSALTPDQVRERAAAAYAADAELVQLASRARSGTPGIKEAGLKEERVQALIIAQAWRNLETEPVPAAADTDARERHVSAAFQKAASDVLGHTLAANEASRLSRSAENLTGAINDIVARGGQNGELQAIARDNGRTLVQVLETSMPMIASADQVSLASSYEVRRKLIDCVALRLPSVTIAEPLAANLPVERAAASTAQDTRTGRLLSAIADDARSVCAPMLAPVRATPVPASLPPRKATLPQQDVRARLAGQPVE